MRVKELKSQDGETVCSPGAASPGKTTVQGMKSCLCVLLSFLFLFSFDTELAAQKRQIKKADTAFCYHRYNEAVTLYQKAYARLSKRSKGTDPDLKNRLLYQIAQSYRLSGDFKLAMRQYQRCIRAGYYKVEPALYYELANLQLSAGDYEESIENFRTYLSYVPDDSAGMQGLRGSFLAQRFASQASRYQVENFRGVNSKDGDWNPRYFIFEGTPFLAFSSTREGVTGKQTDPWTGQRFSDIFIAEQDPGKESWDRPVKLDRTGTVGTAANESDASFCNGGKTVYYTLCGSEEGNPSRCVIMTSNLDKETKAWSDPEEVDINGDTLSDFVHPFITEDGSRLYFASNMEGGFGDLDIWYAEGSGSSFGVPVNMNWEKTSGPEEIDSILAAGNPDGYLINTQYKEAYPFQRNDTLFYFSSTGHQSAGGYDIFRAVKRGDVFSGVERLDYPVNTNADDFGICFLPEGNKGFFSSNRGGGRGGDDIYSFYLPDILFTISGTVTSTETLQPVPDAEVTLAGSDGMLMASTTDQRGFYQFGSGQVNENTTYKIVVEKRNYLGAEGTETTVGLVASKDFVHDFKLEPVPRGPVVLPEILYDLGKWDLKEQYQDSLMGLIVLLEKNPRLVIELASHTDSRPIAMTNDSLSQYRAQSVVDYLIRRGIDGERLVAKGYGSRVPRTLHRQMVSVYQGVPYVFDSGVVLTDAYIDTLQGRGCQEAAHQLNRRTEFSVLREDYIPSGDRSLSALVGIADTENSNKIPFSWNPDEDPEMRVIANGLGMRAVLDEQSRYSLISIDAAMRLLQAGNLGVNSFRNKEKAFDEEGEVLPNQRLQLKEIKIGQYRIDRIELVTAEESPAEIILNRAGLSKIGSYTIDKENKQIIIGE